MLIRLRFIRQKCQCPYPPYLILDFTWQWPFFTWHWGGPHCICDINRLMDLLGEVLEPAPCQCDEMRKSWGQIFDKEDLAVLGHSNCPFCHENLSIDKVQLRLMDRMLDEQNL